MNNLIYAARLSWGWVSGTGPWQVMGTWLDDDGKVRKYIAGGHAFSNRREALEYRDARNSGSAYDPLGTVFHLIHGITWDRYNR